MSPSSCKSQHTPTTATTTTYHPQHNTTTTTTKDTNTTLSANFAHPAKSSSSPSLPSQPQQQQPHPPTTIDYDHETYLQLVADGHKTPNQVYREERARHRTSRSLDPAIISDPRGEPSSIDFEWAEESQRRSQSQTQC
ncbi:uncharacterized protein BDW47DRAFT_102178 [Aspergillus candidus]|uniref:Uncharacterized protein n=1 Tax=Aspergillus candidus TaxID=41067 RepID=A0A2I2FHF3_ASPCN|nr:hypothetical protein BDW47DRAFT_102178 [Aspergillus candidus]PLB40061.1 hypothetical protein BDW47DRAFT_102178 [Aspergillus candidus]